VSRLAPILLVYFPELVRQGGRDKYSDCVLWMMREYSIVSPHMRDTFSAGGMVEMTYLGHRCYVSKLVHNLIEYIPTTAEVIRTITADSVNEVWGTNVRSELIPLYWLKMLHRHLGTHKNPKFVRAIVAKHILQSKIALEVGCSKYLEEWVI